jgi:ketosteroid isomerase-like protein
MSRENVEVVTSVYDAWARRDQRSAFRVHASDIEWDMSRALGDFGTDVYHGHDGVREWFRDLLAAFTVLDFSVEEITEAGDHVLATVHDRYVGRRSGAEVETHHYAVWTLRDRKITRLCVYLDRAEALEAAGLRE